MQLVFSGIRGKNMKFPYNIIYEETVQQKALKRTLMAKRPAFNTPKISLPSKNLEISRLVFFSFV